MMSSDCVGIGIDLGTSYCSVAVLQGGVLKVLEDEHGNRRIPCYVAFTDKEYLVGNTAKSQAVVNPENTVYAAKRMLGNVFDSENVRTYEKWLPFQVINNDGKGTKFQVNYKSELEVFYAQEIIAMVLANLKAMAESHLGHEVSKAVISVPASFNHLQRNAIINAAKIAGMVVDLINDPTAAALAYCTEKKIVDTRNLLVFDFGGGSLDISLLSIHDQILEVKEEFGHSQIGGEDFDNNLMSCKKEEFQNDSNTEIGQKRFLARLKNAFTTAKHDLSKLPETCIEVEGCEKSIQLNRGEFEECSKDLFESIDKIMAEVSNNETIKSTEYDILLVGGSTRIPKIEQLLNKNFEGIRISKGINRDEAVAYGAAVQDALSKGDKSDLVSHIKEKEKVHEPIAKDQDFSQDEINAMRERAKKLKSDSVDHHQNMKCRNELEGFIIAIQSEFGKHENQNTNENILNKCNEILDWMENNEEATSAELESKHEELRNLKRVSEPGNSAFTSLETQEGHFRPDNGDNQNADNSDSRSISPESTEKHVQNDGNLVHEKSAVESVGQELHISNPRDDHSALESNRNFDNSSRNSIEDVNLESTDNNHLNSSKEDLADISESKEECQQDRIAEDTGAQHGENHNAVDLPNQVIGEEKENTAALVLEGSSDSSVATEQSIGDLKSEDKHCALETTSGIGNSNQAEEENVQSRHQIDQNTKETQQDGRHEKPDRTDNHIDAHQKDNPLHANAKENVANKVFSAKSSGGEIAKAAVRQPRKFEIQSKNTNNASLTPDAKTRELTSQKGANNKLANADHGNKSSLTEKSKLKQNLFQTNEAQSQQQAQFIKDTTKKPTESTSGVNNATGSGTQAGTVHDKKKEYEEKQRKHAEPVQRNTQGSKATKPYEVEKDIQIFKSDGTPIQPENPAVMQKPEEVLENAKNKLRKPESK